MTTSFRSCRTPARALPPGARITPHSREGGLHVFDVWDSQESFAAFGETLMPILAEAGIDPGEPMVSPVHNIIIG
jgi:hypothetical protein